MKARLPRLLDQSFGEVTRLRPTAASATISLREPSTAQITLADETVQMRNWVELYAGEDSLGLFRVTNIDRAPRRETTLTLRHCIDTLADDIWAAETEFDGTVAQFLTQLLSYQSTQRWQLGVCECAENYKKTISYTLLSENLWAMADEFQDYYFDYDLTTTPWTLNFRALPTECTAEFRLSRNVESAQIRRDDEAMFTRLIVQVQDGPNPGLRTYDAAAAQALYGIITKTASVKVADVPDPDTWAQALLAKRCSPTVQVTVDGYELSRLTGETFDHMSVGKSCRLAVPLIAEYLQENIVSVTYPDLLGEPERVTVELSNHLQKFSESIVSLKKAAGGSGGGGSAMGGGGMSTLEEVTYWGQVVTKTGVRDIYETGLWLDAETGATIYSLQEGVRANRGEITVNSQNISLVVTDGSINAASITAAIDAAGSRATISADKIVLDGETLTNALSATNARITNLTTGMSEATKLHTQTLWVDNRLSVFRTLATWQEKTFTDGGGNSITLHYLGYT